MSTAGPLIAITAGEPAGIGPDIVLALAQQTLPARAVVIADPDLLAARAEQLHLDIRLQTTPAGPGPHTPGALYCHPVAVNRAVRAGRLDTANAEYVLNTLKIAVDGCRRGDWNAMVTAPVHKGVINDAGIAFTGHTEFLAHLTGGDPVMMLAADTLRVALATTHLPLKAVSDAITEARLTRCLEVLHHDLITRFGLSQPVIAVAGLNPHAGEGGHLGDEEQRIIIPVLEALRQKGMALKGPLPADTLFTPANLPHYDAVLAMYHDQGLPVLKHAGFGRAVNITLGLPIIRTSVDHGTALDLAGSGRADPGSLIAAFKMAAQLAVKNHENP